MKFIKSINEMPFVCNPVCRSSIMSGVYPSHSYNQEQTKKMKKCVGYVHKIQVKPNPKTTNIEMNRPSSR